MSVLLAFKLLVFKLSYFFLLFLRGLVKNLSLPNFLHIARSTNWKVSSSELKTKSCMPPQLVHPCLFLNHMSTILEDFSILSGLDFIQGSSSETLPKNEIQSRRKSSSSILSPVSNSSLNCYVFLT